MFWEGVVRREERSLDSDGGAGGTGRVELGKHPFFWEEGFCYLGKAVWD